MASVDGETDDEDLMWEWCGVGQICVCCGTAREGTASATNIHWLTCAGIVAYGRMTILGIDPWLAAVAARQLSRELLAMGTIVPPSTLWDVERPLRMEPSPKVILTRLDAMRRANKEVDSAFQLTLDRMETHKSTAPFAHARHAVKATEGRTLHRKATP